MAGSVARDGQGRIDAAVIIGLTIAAARTGNGDAVPCELTQALDDAMAKGCGASAMVRDWIDRRRRSVRASAHPRKLGLSEANHDR
jgi:hypothetical protein